MNKLFAYKIIELFFYNPSQIYFQIMKMIQRSLFFKRKLVHFFFVFESNPFRK
ncbi:hypothetical protein LBBP_02455 [Leptospira borgpetersenii serovar Ballum]|uniref:Uncharacterized protein n=1 Tax=Leptospira borgpetersenii serovar Ballum TaxID=280505 RepID=A0A0S2IT65_LEPBO|nr:hypothetical protein LBBP_02455 [Leptospira borgpetersenii serovar Ballum]